MKRSLLSTAFVFLSLLLFSQENTELSEGKVSFISSQSVYVKFISTEQFNKGDTLFSISDDILTPVLIIKSLSSISVVCRPLESTVLKINDLVYARVGKITAEEKEETIVKIEQDTAVEKNIIAEPGAKPKPVKTPKKTKSNVRGRLTANSYSGFAGTNGESFLRMRYIASFSITEIKGTNFSAESYISFNNKSGGWSDIPNTLNNALKIYNLAIKYKSEKGTELILGRKINTKISNLGATDGLQFSQKVKSFNLGAFVGSHPDHADYSFNPELLQYGAFISQGGQANKGFFQSSIAMVEQKNKAATDRQFLYFQHYNTILKNLYTFVSFEADLYKVVNNTAQSTFDLTGFYFMLRYNLTKKFRISTSYDVRNNVIYYETYKSYLDQLLQNEARQGFNIRLNYRISNNINWGASGTYRFRKHDPSPSSNYSSYISIRNLLLDDSRTNVTVNMLNTSYLNGGIYSLSYGYPLAGGKIYADLRYRLFLGKYRIEDVQTTQHTINLDLNWLIIDKLSLNFSYEIQGEGKYVSNRLYISLSKRF